MHSLLQIQVNVSNICKEKMGYPYTQIEPQRHTGACARTIHSRVTSGAQRERGMTAEEPKYAKAKRQKKRRDTPAGRCAMTTAGQPRRNSRRRSSEDLELAESRWQTLPGACRARRREAMAGRRAVRQENMAGSVPSSRGAPRR